MQAYDIRSATGAFLLALGSVLSAVPTSFAAAPGASDWLSIRVPGAWEEMLPKEAGRYDGFAWYRCFVEIPKAWEGQPLRLELGRIDDTD